MNNITIDLTGLSRSLVRAFSEPDVSSVFAPPVETLEPEINEDFQAEELEDLQAEETEDFEDLQTEEENLQTEAAPTGVIPGTFSIQATTIKSALSQLPKVKSNALSVLENVRVVVGARTARLITFDLELYAHVDVPVFTSGAGSFLIHYSDLEILSRLKGNVVFEFQQIANDGSWLAVVTHSSGRNEFNVSLDSDFPTNVPLTGEYLCAKNFEEIHHLTDFVSKEEHRPAMTGILINGTEAAATDGYTLCKHPFEFKTDKEFIIPTKIIKLLKWAKVSYTNERLIFECGNSTYSVRFIDERFPLYNNVIPKDYKANVELDATTVLEAIRAVGKKYFQVIMNFRLIPGKCHLTFKQHDGPDSMFEIPVKSTFDDVIGFNVNYLKRCLNKESQVTLAIESPTRAIIIEGKKWALLMPMRVS